MQKLVKKIVITDAVIRFGIEKLLLQANLYLSVTLGQGGQPFSVRVPKSAKIKGQIFPRANRQFVFSPEI